VDPADVNGPQPFTDIGFIEVFHQNIIVGASFFPNFTAGT
jgi:hypothetical protein